MPADLKPAQADIEPVTTEAIAQAEQLRLPKVPEFTDPTDDQITGMDLVPFQMPGVGEPIWVPRALLGDWAKDPKHAIAMPLTISRRASPPSQQLAA